MSWFGEQRKFRCSRVINLSRKFTIQINLYVINLSRKFKFQTILYVFNLRAKSIFKCVHMRACVYNSSESASQILNSTIQIIPNYLSSIWIAISQCFKHLRLRSEWQIQHWNVWICARYIHVHIHAYIHTYTYQ
jgi:hypothetical protein